MFNVLVRAEEAIKSLAQYSTYIGNIEQRIRELRKEQQKEGADTKQIEKDIQRLTQARKAYQKSVQEATKELQNSIKVDSYAEGSLVGLRAELSKLNAEYDRLSHTDREGSMGEGLQKRINEVTAEIKEAEFATQRFYRNVGNYPNQLSLSVQQVARELPSLTLGANQFFLAISNNLPMLADQIAVARKEYAEAVAQGKEATPVSQQLLSSIGSWQTALVVGITLLSTYGKDMAEFVKSLFVQKEAFDASAKAAEEYHRVMLGGRKQGYEDIAQLQTLYQVATDASRAMDLRREAVALLRKEYPAYLENLSDEEIMTGRAAGAYTALRDKMLEMAQTRAIMDRLTELNSAQISREYEAVTEAQNKLTEAEQKYNVELTDNADTNRYLKARYDIYTNRAKKDLEKALEAFNEAYKMDVSSLAEIDEYYDVITNKLLDGITTFRTELQDATTQELTVEDIDLGDIEDDRLEAWEEARASIDAKTQEILDADMEALRQQAQALKDAYALALEGLQDNPMQALEAQYSEAMAAINADSNLSADARAFYIQALEEQLAKKRVELQDKADKEAYALRRATLDSELQLAWDNAKEQYEIKRAFLEKELEDEKLTAEERARLEQELAELDAQYRQQKVDNFQNYADQVMELANSVNSVFNALDEQQLQKAEETNKKEKASLKKRLDAGLISEEEYNKKVEKLDADLDAKKAEIARKQAIRDKALSVAQIAINTALAIMRIWADVPKLDLGISTTALTAIAAAIGAAQMAAVIATPIPQARQGGMVSGATHENGGVLVNMEDKERIISAKPAQAFPELLNLMSYIGKHANIPDTGFAARALLSGSASAGSINTDELAQKIGANVAEAVQQMPIYLALTELNNAQDEYARIIQSAKQ